MSSVTNLFDPPPKYVLPLSLGGDLSVDFKNNPSGDAVTFEPYDLNITVTLHIDTDPPIAQDAIISAEHAIVKIESAVTDLILTGTKWRLIVTTTETDPSTETVAANGKIKRYDS